MERAFLLLGVALLMPAQAASEGGKLYSDRLKEVDRKSPDSWISLADFCESRLWLQKREEALRKALTVEPDHPEARRRLDERRAEGGWLPVDKADAMESAQAKGKVYYGTAWLSAEEAKGLCEKDAPESGWAHALRMDTPHLRIFSDGTWSLVRKIADLLENEIEVYRRFHPPCFSPDPRLQELRQAPLVVFLFSDLATFRTVAGSYRTLGPDVAGFYMERPSMLMLSRDPRDPMDQVLECTAVHEMLHALDHRLAGITDLPYRLPGWLIEGRACHFGWSILGRQVIPGSFRFAPAEAYPEVLERTVDRVQLEALIRQPLGRAFRQPEYVASWALVHFLYHGEESRYADGFRRYLEGLFPAPVDPSGIPQLPDLEALFKSAIVDPNGIEGAFKEHAKKTLIPRAKASRIASAKVSGKRK